MSQDLPLPYTGAITLKNILQNTLLLNNPLQIDANKQSKKCHEERSTEFSAIVGNSLWDSINILPYTDINDFKVEMLDNDDFWNELNNPKVLNDMGPVEEYLQGTPPLRVAPRDSMASRSPIELGIMPPSPISQRSPSLTNALMHSSASSPTTNSSGPGSPVVPPKDKFFDKYSPEALVLASVPGEGIFNPEKRKFNLEELKPQPVLKKSRKMFVPDEMKDDRYWARRQKNNTAAKRSRDARRIKENQIALRAGFLEEENEYLGKELAKLRAENKGLRARLEKYEPV